MVTLKGLDGSKAQDDVAGNFSDAAIATQNMPFEAQRGDKFKDSRRPFIDLKQHLGPAIGGLPPLSLLA